MIGTEAGIAEGHGSGGTRRAQLLQAVQTAGFERRLKMLEEEGIVAREQISSLPPHVVYRLTEMGEQLSGAIRELTRWSRTWLCGRPHDFAPVQMELSVSDGC